MRHLPRILFSLLAGGTIALALLWMMQWMLLHKDPSLQADRTRPVMEFVRLKRETETRLRERRQLEPEPEPEEIPPPKPELQETPLTKPRIRAPNIRLSAPEVPLALTGPYIGPVRQGPPDRDFMVISRIPPRYPYRAQRRGLEGWVKVSLLITDQGTVQDVVVVEAEPEGVFDNAAIRAVSRWKFKPRIENGRAVAVRAEQVVTFKLDNR
jgi:protein TonB